LASLRQSPPIAWLNTVWRPARGSLFAAKNWVEGNRVRPTISARLGAGFGIVGVGILVAVATNMALTALSSAKLAFALGGFALLIPTIVVEHPEAYWLFLLVMSIPFDITKSLSLSMVDSQALIKTYGMPMTATVGLDIYLSDVILAAMLLPWLACVCLRRVTLYFPKIAYFFVFYLAWALLVSLVNATSLYLSMFELCRQVLWFLFFIYLVNNVSTRLQFRSIVLAVFLGFIISAATVVVFFELGIGTDTVAFVGLHDQTPATGSTRPYTMKKDSTPGLGTMTLHIGEQGPGSLFRGEGSEVKRSQGMFRHPGVPASLSGLVLPIVLAYLITVKKKRDRILFFLVYALGFLSLLLTFSRAGLIGFIVGIIAFFVIASWSGLISRRAFKLGLLTLTLIGALSMPILLIYLWTRPESFIMRFYMFEAAIEGYASHPILGVGLNNSTAAMRAPRQELTDMGIPMGTSEPADSYYLAILSEVGPLGSFLYFGFFANIMMIALGSMRQVAVDMKRLLVGMVAGLTALATQSIADGPLAGHAVGGALWLFAALIVAIRRSNPAETRPALAGGEAALVIGPRREDLV
jgi:O-Antigen ligase